MEMKKRINQVLALIGFGFLSVSFTSAQNTVVNDDAMASINQNGNWLSYGRTHSEQRFSPLTDITKENVGALQPDWYFPIPNSRSLVSTPLVVDGVIYFVASLNIVRALDATSGEELWSFNPQVGQVAFENSAMEMAAETWTGEWWRHGGGGNSWHGWTYDAELEQLYIGTGNGSPWNRKIRSPSGGDNLFLDSIVALDPDTGAYLWHHQNTPGETWDYNSNMDIVLADLVIDGEPIQALMQAPKNGFFYVINRKNGELLSAEKITEVTWASHYDLDTARPAELPGVRYETSAIRISPGPVGAHSWHAMSFNPNTGLAYIPSIHSSTVYGDAGIDIENFERQQWRLNTGVNSRPGGGTRDDAPASLQAWDPVRQEQVWEVLADDIWNAGTLTTASNLLFQGRADGHLIAYDAETGEELWDYDLGLGISAPDLRASGVPLLREAFENVVRNGALSDNGMPIYRDLTDEQLESLRHYIRSQAEVTLRTNQ